MHKIVQSATLATSVALLVTAVFGLALAHEGAAYKGAASDQLAIRALWVVGPLWCAVAMGNTPSSSGVADMWLRSGKQQQRPAAATPNPPATC